MLRVPSPLKEHNKSCPVAGSVTSFPLHSQHLVWMSCPATWVTRHFMCASITVAPLRKIHGRHSHRALQIGCSPPHSCCSQWVFTHICQVLQLLRLTYGCTHSTPTPCRCTGALPPSPMASSWSTSSCTTPTTRSLTTCGPC